MQAEGRRKEHITTMGVRGIMKHQEVTADLGPVCLGCGWLAVQGKLLSRESCCAGKAAVLRLAVWLLGWLSRCMLRNCLKYPHSS
jgi:hypothetical protein